MASSSRDTSAASSSARASATAETTPEEALPRAPSCSIASPPGQSAVLEVPPKVTSVVPATFVPLDMDLTAPFDPPRSRIERAQEMLRSIDFFHTGVRRGMIHLADMDRQHILGMAAAAAVTGGGSMDGLIADGMDAGLSTQEADALIEAMSAPAVAGADYSASDASLGPPGGLGNPPPLDRYRGRRADAVLQLQQVVEQALTQLHGYEGHISGIRARWVNALEREQQLLDTRFGGLPGGGGGSTTDGIAGSKANSNSSSGSDSKSIGITSALVSTGSNTINLLKASSDVPKI